MIHFCKLLDATTGVVDRHFTPAEISQFRSTPGKVIWLDVAQPTPDDLTLLAEEFHFHPLTLEDCLKAHQRPKLEQYKGYVFLVLYELTIDPATLRTLTREVHMFVGSNYVVTLHRHGGDVIDEVERRWDALENLEDAGASYLAYLIIDRIVDSYFPALDRFSDRLGELEEGIFGHFDPEVVSEIFELKKQLLMVRRLVTPLRDVFLTLLRREGGVFTGHTYVYFQDVLDHLLRISDSIDTYRDLVSSAVDAYMSMVSMRMNDIMKKLTVAATVLMTVALVPAIYGMNFHIPELTWTYGYFYSLGLMAVIALVLTGLFKWRKYL